MLPLGEESDLEKFDGKIRREISWLVPLVAAAVLGFLGKAGYFQERWFIQLDNDTVFNLILIFGAVGTFVESINLGWLYYKRHRLHEQQNT